MVWRHPHSLEEGVNFDFEFIVVVSGAWFVVWTLNLTKGTRSNVMPS